MQMILSGSHGYLMERLLENRGYSSDFLFTMEKKSVNPMTDMGRLCDILYYIHETGIELTQISDFDVDGICSDIIGFAGLTELGFRANLYIPSVTGGYGFDDKTIEDMMQRYPNTRAIITSDVGITCDKGIREAKRRGLIVLVTDHHSVFSSYVLEKADAVVDPSRHDELYENPGICGAYVLYQCLEQYASRFCSRQMFEQIRRLRVFAGIGTVADSMPMLYENRSLVRESINICRMVYSSGNDFMVTHIGGTEVYRRAFAGLFRVLTYLASMGKIDKPSDIDEDLFGYYIAPMFNSVKRMGDDLRRGLGIFFGATPDKDMEYLYELNNARKSLVATKLKDLLAADQPYAPYIWLSDADKGVLGLLAQKLRDRTGQPCLVINPAFYSGSGRAPGWYPFLERLKSISVHAAGHMASFGVSVGGLDDMQRIVDFLSSDVAVYESQLTDEQRTANYDFVIDTHGNGDTGIDIIGFREFLDDVASMAPYGPGFEAPDILLRFYPGEDEPEFVRMGGLKQHLKINLAQGFQVILWNHGSLEDTIKKLSVCEVRGKLGLNVYMDRYTVIFTGEALLPQGIQD